MTTPSAQNPYGMMPEQSAADAMAASQQGGDWQAQARAAQAAGEQYAAQQAASPQAPANQYAPSPEQLQAARAMEQHEQRVDSADWSAQARSAGRDAIAGQASAIVAKLPKWGLSLMGLGALLAVWNIVNSLAVIDDLGFFGAYFLVQSPVNALQAYGSVVGLVGGAVLLGVGIALNRRRG